MRIVLLGNKRAPYCSEVYYKQELESLDVEVVFLQETEVTAEQVLAFSKEADALFWVHTHGWDTPGMDNVLKELRKLKIPSFAYHLDLYMPLPERWAQYKDSSYFKGLDYFFTVDKLMADWLNDNTNTKGIFLPPGVPTAQCYMEDHYPEYDSKVTFIGSKRYHNSWQWRPKLINFLSTYPGFVQWGNDGKKLVRQSEINKAYASSLVSIGDTYCHNFTYPDYVSDRLFNQTGAGAFALHPYIKGIENYFELDKEIVTFDFGDLSQLKDKIDYYLANPRERNDIRIAGYLRTKKEHTYRHRMQTIIKEIGL